MTLAQLIRLTRKARGATLRELEGVSGISNAYLSQIETGWVTSISLRKAAKLAAALGLTLDQMAATTPGKQRRGK